MIKLRSLKSIPIHAILILASFIAVFPVLWILSTSFKPYEEVFSTTVNFIPDNFTIENYIYVFTKGNYIFFKWIKNSAIVAIATTIFGVFLSTTAAYALSRFKFIGHKPIMYMFLVTQMFPGALLLIPLYNLMNSFSLLNTYWGLILAYSTVAVPFSVWMLKGFFDTIPYELEEAARVDGLSQFGTFWRIVLPLSLPGLSVTAFFSFITAWNEFMIALTFMNNEEMYTLPIGLQQFVNQFNTDWHYMSAGAIIVTIPVLVLFFFAQKYLVSGLTTGGTKG
ncbi:ABC transporter permease [Vulcanibacillus modesticaldus]|uniref:ABC transporter permease n=1 Tax=Vulcanibacillus modesticaldus TaxID=337097 RepID=A0A1D2YTG0_9BACI|nr:carbohydrate ABC transporter permease [Vulcanibacillus modesticaldus]OEF98983.1 ABC transporter permease [Vulcanibacillus modesticaldus]